MDLFLGFCGLTLEVGLLPQQIADGSLELWVFSVAGVDVRLAVGPEEKFSKQLILHLESMENTIR